MRKLLDAGRDRFATMATSENWYYTSRGISNKQAVLLVKQALGNNLPGVWPCGAGEMVNFVTERGGIRERGNIAAHAYGPKEIAVAFRRLQGSATRAKMTKLFRFIYGDSYGDHYGI